jgi:membrane protein
VSDAEPVDSAEAQDQPPKKGRFKAMLLPLLMRYRLPRRGLGIQAVYRNTGGGLIVGGLAYAALFAIIPTFALVVAGIYLLVDDTQLRQEAIDMISSALPALQGVTEPALRNAGTVATAGSVIALIGFAWGASGLYLNLTRAMERFFPGERVSGVLARVLGVLLVVLVIVGVLAAVFFAGALTLVARALALDAEWLLGVIGASVTLALATVIVYGVYRLMPANPPSPDAARLPAFLVGIAIGAMTLFYSFISPWLVSGFQMFGVMASVFVALIWLRWAFLAMVYGAAMARYRDYIVAARELDLGEGDLVATTHALAEEADRIAREIDGGKGMSRQQAATAEGAAEEPPEATPPEQQSARGG